MCTGVVAGKNKKFDKANQTQRTYHSIKRRRKEKLKKKSSNGNVYAAPRGIFIHLPLLPPDVYPAYRRVKAGENGWGLAYTGLYTAIRGVKIR